MFQLGKARYYMACSLAQDRVGMLNSIDFKWALMGDSALNRRRGILFRYLQQDYYQSNIQLYIRGHCIRDQIPVTLLDFIRPVFILLSWCSLGHRRILAAHLAVELGRFRFEFDWVFPYKTMQKATKGSRV